MSIDHCIDSPWHTTNQSENNFTGAHCFVLGIVFGFKAVVEQEVKTAHLYFAHGHSFLDVCPVIENMLAVLLIQCNDSLQSPVSPFPL